MQLDYGGWGLIALSCPPLSNYAPVAKPSLLTHLAYHWMEMSVKMRFLGHKGIPEIKPLNERSAVELGAEALGEAIVLSICMALICVEYRRGKLKEAKKEQARIDQNVALKRQVEELGLKIETLSTEFRGMNTAQRLKDVEQSK
jgi:hypothetical protein